MKYISLILKSSLKNNLRMRNVALVTFGVVFICVIGLTVLFSTQFIRPEVNSANPDRSVLENFLGLILFITSFMSVGIYANVFSFQSLTREKARGNIQALLATPVKPSDFWLGKSLGVFLPGLVFALVMTLAVLLIVNSIYFIPVQGFVANPWMLLSSFVAVPLVYLSLTLLVLLIGLVAKPATANALSQVFLPVMVALMINLAIRNIPGAASWIFTLILVGFAVVFSLVTLRIYSRLTPEKIILSG